VLNVVQGFGVEAGKPLASSPRIAKIAFTGETTTGRLIMQYASENLIPVTLELGGKSPNIFFADVMDADDDFFDKALEGFAMFALNQGEVCTCPSRALVQESIYDRFMERAVARTKAIVEGNPLDPTTMIGAQASNDQLEKILSYIDIGKKEGAKVLTGGARRVHGASSRTATTCSRRSSSRPQQDADLPGGDLRPVVSVTKFKDFDRRARTSPTTRSTASAPACGRATGHRATHGPRHQGRPRLDQLLPPYPAHAAFGGYKQSGIGRENHKMMLDHYQQTKNLLVSYCPKKLGFF
jgi:aldehyde dehydrogenase